MAQLKWFRNVLLRDALAPRQDAGAPDEARNDCAGQTSLLQSTRASAQESAPSDNISRHPLAIGAAPSPLLIQNRVTRKALLRPFLLSNIAYQALNAKEITGFSFLSP